MVMTQWLKIAGLMDILVFALLWRPAKDLVRGEDGPPDRKQAAFYKQSAIPGHVNARREVSGAHETLCSCIAAICSRLQTCQLETQPVR